MVSSNVSIHITPYTYSIHESLVANAFPTHPQPQKRNLEIPWKKVTPRNCRQKLDRSDRWSIKTTHHRGTVVVPNLRNIARRWATWSFPASGPCWWLIVLRHSVPCWRKSPWKEVDEWWSDKNDDFVEMRKRFLIRSDLNNPLFLGWTIIFYHSLSSYKARWTVNFINLKGKVMRFVFSS